MDSRREVSIRTGRASQSEVPPPGERASSADDDTTTPEGSRRGRTGYSLACGLCPHTRPMPPRRASRPLLVRFDFSIWPLPASRAAAGGVLSTDEDLHRHGDEWYEWAGLTRVAWRGGGRSDLLELCSGEAAAAAGKGERGRKIDSQSQRTRMFDQSNHEEK